MPLLDVADEGVVRPAVPQSRHHVVELARAAIALAVLHVLVEPEIQRRVRIGGGDDVPAGAAAADVVERGEPARDVIGRVEGGRAGGDEADMLGRLRASADSSVNGSNEVTVWLRLSASIGMFSTARWSAMKKASNLPRSSVCAKRLMCAKLKFASGKAPG